MCLCILIIIYSIYILQVNRNDSLKLESSSKENRRLKGSFRTVCSYNLKLRKQVSSMHSDNSCIHWCALVGGSTTAMLHYEEATELFECQTVRFEDR